jgi:hypothetical protein
MASTLASEVEVGVVAATPVA